MRKITSLVALSLVVFSACSFSFSTANIGEVRLCTELNSDGACSEASTTFGTDVTRLNATAELNNAPADTLVRGEWWQMEPNGKMAEVKYQTKENENFIYFNISIPDPLPIGDYELRIFLGDATEPDKVVKFNVQG